MAFRSAAERACGDLMRQVRKRMSEKRINPDNVIVVIILRAATAFLSAATRAFPDAPVGVLGLKRDERTLKPRWYYENLPAISKKNTVILLDPMLATGGSAKAAVERLRERGANPKNMHFVGVVAAPAGVARLAELIPRENILVAAVDKGLDERGMIVPGIGDFGDRYFGYPDSPLPDLEHEAWLKAEKERRAKRERWRTSRLKRASRKPKATEEEWTGRARWSRAKNHNEHE